MRILAFRHGPADDVGHVRPVLEERGIRLECVDLYRKGAALPEVRNAGGLIFLGGSMSVNDNLPWLNQEIQLIADALERDQPVLGICLGAQLMARALGACVARNPVPEIGWFQIQFTASASEDQLFGGLREPLTVFQWHEETFQLPTGAERLAYSDTCANQAFRFGRSGYAVQFHPEVTPAMIEEWGGEAPADPPDPYANTAGQATLAAHLFGRWAELL